MAINLQKSVKPVSLDALNAGVRISPRNIPTKVRAHLAQYELPHATNLNVSSVPTGLNLETSSKEVENEGRNQPIISNVK